MPATGMGREREPPRLSTAQAAARQSWPGDACYPLAEMAAGAFAAASISPILT
jgi:hypothetical protein